MPPSRTPLNSQPMIEHHGTARRPKPPRIHLDPSASRARAGLETPFVSDMVFEASRITIIVAAEERRTMHRLIRILLPLPVLVFPTISPRGATPRR
ncbi:hypothetical protein N9411_00020 [bacterium]|nr:hypothetical protein [bacterium]